MPKPLETDRFLHRLVERKDYPESGAADGGRPPTIVSGVTFNCLLILSNSGREVFAKAPEQLLYSFSKRRKYWPRLLVIVPLVAKRQARQPTRRI